MAKPNEPADDREPHGELWVERWILPALRETALLPVVLVVVGHLVAFMAPMWIFALRDRALGALFALLALLVLSLECVRFEWRRYGRPALLSGWISGTWLASIAAAWACHRYQLF
jgi:predicted ABC-type exoprotein transport system permease subunit